MLTEGKKAPSFTLESFGGEKISLKDYAGKIVVLYFYPKDNTPGCTKEACGFNDSLSKIKRLGAVVFGISRDSVSSHEKFRDNYSLQFKLLADTDGAVCRKYDVIKEKNMFGKIGLGIQRSTFIISPEGKIAKVFPKVSPDGHADEVIAAIKELQK